MIVKVTNLVKNGELVLPTLDYAVKAGVELTISDEDYYCNDIQIAIRKGFIVIIDNQGHGNSPFAKKIAVTNLTGRPLALDGISLLIGETSYISEREYNSTNVRTAINAGMIQVEMPEKEQAEEEAEEEPEYEQPVPRRGQSVRASDVVALLEQANRVPQNKKASVSPKTKVLMAPAKKLPPGPKRTVAKLLVNPTRKTVNASQSIQKPTSKFAPKQNMGKKPPRLLLEQDDDGHDQLSRLQKIASQIDVGSSVSRSSFRDEDPVDRLTRLAQEIEQDQNPQNQYEDKDADFVDRNQEDVQGEMEDEAEMEARLDEARNQASGTRMSAWNPHTKAMMGRREASNKVAKLISSPARPTRRSVNEEGIMTGEVDFTDEGVRGAKKVVSAPMRKGAARKPGLQPVGRRRGEPGSEDSDMDFIDAQDHDEIVFVDREQNAQRLRSRPDIMRRTRSNNVEID